MMDSSALNVSFTVHVWWLVETEAAEAEVLDQSPSSAFRSYHILIFQWMVQFT